MAGGSRDGGGPGTAGVSALYLVRHGQAAFGSDDYDRLTPLGAEQCAWLARHWRSIDRTPALVYAGAMRRHRESAEAFVAALAAEGVVAPALETVPGLEEYDHVALLDGFARLNAGTPDFAACWRDRRVLHQTLQRALAAWTGEGVRGYGAFAGFRDRCAAALDGIMRRIGRGREAVLFASAGSLAAAMQPVLGIGDWPAMRLTLDYYNTGVSKVLFTEASASVESINGIAHLERPGMLDLITKR
jgi:broad specificity phosphatase PhoE